MNDEEYQGLVREANALVLKHTEQFKGHLGIDLGDVNLNFRVYTPFVGEHFNYVDGLNDALRLVAEKYQLNPAKVKPLMMLGANAKLVFRTEETNSEDPALDELCLKNFRLFRMRHPEGHICRQNVAYCQFVNRKRGDVIVVKYRDERGRQEYFRCECGEIEYDQWRNERFEHLLKKTE